MLPIANMITSGLGIYLAIGCLYALYFITIGIRGPGIEGKSILLRAMLFPGAVLIWPFLVFGKVTP